MKKKYRNLILFAVIFTFIFQSVSFAEDSTTKAQLSVDGLVSTLNTSPVEKDGRIFVGIKEILNVKLNVSLSWHEPSKTVNVMRGDKLLFQITPGKNSIFVNGKAESVDYTPYIENEDIMIPLSLVSEQLGILAEYDSNKNMIIIDTQKESSSKIESGQRDGKSITFDEAIDKAFETNSSLKNLKDSQDLTEYSKKQLSDRFVAYSESQSAIYGSDSQLGDVLTLMQTDISLESIPYQQEIIEGSIKAGIKSCFNNILGYEKDLEYKKKSVEHDKILLDVAKKKVELGLLSQYEYNKQEEEYNKELQDIKTIENNIENEYRSLGILIDSKDKYVISYSIDGYNPIGQVDINRYANQSQYSNPSLKVKELAVKQKQNSLKISTTTREQYMSNQNAYNQAERDFEDAKDSFTQKVLSTYNNIKSTEQEYDKALKDMEQLKKDKEVLTVKYNSGLASAIEMETMDFGIVSQQYKIDKLIINLDTLKYTFERPYLLG